MKPLFTIHAGVLAALMLAGGAGAQIYPARTVRLILPFPPGGPSDLLGRPLAQRLGEQTGVQVVVDNRPGAGGNIGLELVAKAPPDGYTLVQGAPELLQSLTGIKMVHVPLKGVGQAVIGWVSGEVDVLVMGAPAAAGQAEAGNLRASYAPRPCAMRN